MTTLFDAIEHGDLRSLRQLMRSGIDLEQVDEASGVAPLALAAEGGRLDIVNILIRAGVDPDWGGATTPLEAAALEGHLEVAAALIQATADVNRPVADGFTPLITSSSAGNLAMVRMLLKAGANPLVLDDEGESASSLAKKKGHPEVREALQNHLANYPAQGNGHRPTENLFDAVESRDLARLKQLLQDKKTKDLENTDEAGVTCLGRAAQLGHLALVQALLAAGADIEGGAKPALYCAAEHRHDPVVNFLIEAGADANQPCDGHGKTPIMAAAAAGHVGVIGLLLDAGADAKLADNDRKDALWHAARSGQEQAFTLLLPQIKVADRKSATAELASHVETRRKLAQGAARLIDHINAGELNEAKAWLAGGLIDPDGFDEDGRTAMMLAARLSRRDLLRLLIAAGASFETRDDADGHTALIHAIHSPAADSHMTVSLLTAAGADINRPSLDQRTPIMHAIDHYLASSEKDIDSFNTLAEPLFHAGARLEETDSDGLTAWERVRQLAIREDISTEQRRKLARLRRVLEKYGVLTDGAECIDLMTAVTEGLTGRLREDRKSVV